MFVVERYLRSRWVVLSYAEGPFRDVMECVNVWGIAENTRIRRIPAFPDSLEWQMVGRNIILGFA